MIPASTLHLCAHLTEPPVGCKCGYKGGIWTADGSELICEMGVHKCLGSDMIPVPDNETLRAYACLFAAAPAMLKALKMIDEIDRAYDLPLNEPQRDQLHDAISAAEGRLAKEAAVETERLFASVSDHFVSVSSALREGK